MTRADELEEGRLLRALEMAVRNCQTAERIRVLHALDSLRAKQR